MPTEETITTTPIEAVELDLARYASSIGYDPNFLGSTVDLPKISDLRMVDVVPLKASTEHVLDYSHFSVVMSKSRRLAYFTAVNIDGAQAIELPRVGDRWYFDPRIERQYQSGPSLYRDNDLDRGHLVRRLDPVWGDQAKSANEDTFHFTNAAPQHKKLNQQTWLDLEEYILQNADRENIKVTVFTGPVFRADDMLYRGEYKIPTEYWKVVVILKEDGELSATAYLQTQKNLIEDLEFAYGEYKTYQIPISLVETLAELDFGDLRTHDPLSILEGAVGRVIQGPQDILL